MSTVADLTVISSFLAIALAGMTGVAWYYASELERLRGEYAPPRHAVASPREPRLFFRRLLAARRRKPAVPAGSPTAGAATALLAVRFPCCAHCEDGSPCDPRDNHLAPCGDGCNDNLTAQVREQVITSLPGPAEVTAHADAMFAASEPYLPEPPPMPRPYLPVLDQTVPRPAVPGHAPWQTSEMTAVTAGVEQQMRDEYFGRHAAREPVYGEAPQSVVREAGRLAGVMLP